MKQKEITYKQAVRRLPMCAVGAVEACQSDREKLGEPENFKDLLDGVQHEIDLYIEGERNITNSEYLQCIRYRRWLLDNKLV